MERNEEEFRRQFMGEFTISKRDTALHDRLAKYYRDTPDSMGNKEALKYWRVFSQWRKAHGYSSKEVNYAKRNFQNQHA